MCVTTVYLNIPIRAPEREDLPEQDIRQLAVSTEEAREGLGPSRPPRRPRAASFHQSAEHEQLLPRLGDVALPRAARGAVVAEERERALYHAGPAGLVERSTCIFMTKMAACYCLCTSQLC